MAVSLASSGSWQSSWILGRILGIGEEVIQEEPYIGTREILCMEVIMSDGTRKHLQDDAEYPDMESWESLWTLKGTLKGKREKIQRSAKIKTFINTQN